MQRRRRQQQQRVLFHLHDKPQGQVQASHGKVHRQRPGQNDAGTLTRYGCQEDLAMLASQLLLQPQDQYPAKKKEPKKVPG